MGCISALDEVIGIKGNPTYKVWPTCEAGRRKFQIALTFLLFELSESTTPFWNQQGEARRMITDLVDFVIFEVSLIFNGVFH